ncbi:hypothetical protein PR048_014665 [Dryococelus australis]|uniref:Uncharacterized protein n=1 Tax=Dryococelus australis TaxID=614101 RepID=A0ABQ9HEV0_9NEOP|nr:hypothetical protein PR048_014665 [Dryococelus australis]
MYWLNKCSPLNVKEIILIFPVPGHSLLPPDHVFGRIEIELKHRETIVKSEEYLEIFENRGTVPTLFYDYPVFDWKRISQGNMKKTAAMAFQVFYYQEFNYFPRLDTRWSISCENHKVNINDFNLQQIETGVPVNKVNIRVMTKLLTLHFGEGWEGTADIKLYCDILN